MSMKTPTSIVMALAVSLGSLAQSAAGSPGQDLHALFHASDEGHLKRNPIEALYRGDLRFADQFGDYISDAYFAAEKEAADHDLRALEQIDRRELSATDQISYDVFKYQRSIDLKGYEPALLEAQQDRPIDHFYGVHLLIADLASGGSAAPFRTTKDYEDNLARLQGYVVFLDRAIARMRHGLSKGITNPKLVMENVAQQIDGFLAEGVDGSTFDKPVHHFPDSVPAADQQRLTAAYATFIRETLIPAHTRLRDFLRKEYLPHARESVGLGQMPGGAALYQYLIENTTTTKLKPEQIHALGLAEVTRIRSEMEKIREATGFKGDFKAFAESLRHDPRFAPASAQAMHDQFASIRDRVQAAVGRDFFLMPKSPLEIRPVPAYKEKTDAGGSYEQGTPDGSRPGVFYYNTYDLPTRYTWGYETLFLHEAIPGHHFQISLAQENTGLPAFQRFGGNTAYVEGWALYSESLGQELGMYTDPYQLYGHLNDEMWRALRLVVDTGIHFNGWSRDKAIEYMLDNSATGRTDATAEVERYIAIPSQALAYKLGQLTIRRLRTKAEAALGSRFDVRDFHAQVLDSGALPLEVLESKIDNWIARTGEAAH